MASTAYGLLNDRYQLGELLGEGATATVSRAFDRLLHRDVAVKLLKPAFAQDETVVERFYAEARAAAGLVDAHVVGVYDVVADGPMHAIVMEYVDGPSLAAVLHSEGRLSEARAVAHARQIAQALAAAQARGILHRDIKPANVLLAPGDVVKVADFGLAKAFEQNDLALTEPGRLVGSAYYFSPEQAQGLPLTPASDLYSLGVVLYQLVTGSLPFESTSAVSAAVAHVTQEPPAEGAMVRAMSPALAAIVGRLLRKDPHERFTSAAELAAALAQVDAQEPHDPVWDAPTLLGEMPVVQAPPRNGARRASRSAARRSSKRARTRSRTIGAAVAPMWTAFANVVARIWIAFANGSRHAAARAAALVTAALAVFFAWTRLHSQRTALDALAARVARRASGVSVMGAAIAGAVLVLLIVLVSLARAPETIALADVRHQPVAQARSALASSGLNATVATRADGAIPAGTVIAQSPGPGAALHRGDAVRLVVSSGLPMVTVPNLLGATLAAAHGAMQRLALHGQYAARISGAAANTVIQQFPAAGTRVRAGSPALIVISTGPQPPVVLTNDAPDYAPPGWRRHHRARRHNGGGDGGD